MKTCHKCGQEKPLDAFARSSRAKDGRQVYCRACIAEIGHVRTVAAREKRARRLQEEWAVVAAHGQRFGIRTDLYTDEQKADIVELYRKFFG